MFDNKESNTSKLKKKKQKLLSKKHRKKPLYRSKNYIIRLAENQEEIDEVFRLRYEVFHKELQESPANDEEMEYDEYDKYCDFLILIDKSIDKIIGCYRILPWFKVDEKLGYYSETEFELIDLPREKMAELGRLFIKKEFRNKRLLLILWLGLFKYMKKNKIRYFFGCTSLKKGTTEQDLSLIYSYLEKKNHISKRFKIKAKVAPKKLVMNLDVKKKDLVDKCPKLLFKYVSVGAKVLGEPCFDPHFQVYDFLTIFDFGSIKTNSINSLMNFKEHIHKMLEKKHVSKDKIRS
jgi:putative hemolysin